MRKIEIISRAVIAERGKVLFCRDKTKKHYFLPGGHVEFGEFTESALLRELKEEVSLEVIDTKLIGIAEKKYFQGSKYQQEINFVYYVQCDKLKTESKEGHIEFHLFDRQRFEKEDIRPKDLKKALSKWEKDKEFFHITTID